MLGELRSVATDNEINNFSASLLRNMGIPGVIISPAKDDVDPMTPAQTEEMTGMWRERFTGDNRGLPLIPSLPIKVDMVAFSPDQLALDKLARLTIPRICAAIGLDPLMLGLPSDSKTYANVGEAREAAYEGMLIPFQNEVSSQLTLQLLSPSPGMAPDILRTTPGDFFARDYSTVRVLQEDMDAQYKRLTAAVGGPWLRANEAREQVGLEPIEGGDVLYQPRSAGGFGMDDERPLPRAASRSPEALKSEIASRWRARAKVREEERKALPARNGA